jgi:hypothetical protein
MHWDKNHYKLCNVLWDKKRKRHQFEIKVGLVFCPYFAESAQYRWIFVEKKTFFDIGPPLYYTY